MSIIVYFEARRAILADNTLTPQEKQEALERLSVVFNETHK
jgi:lipase chaperone LimK